MTLRRRTYEELDPISPADAEAALASGDAGAIGTALLRLALHGPDRVAAERLALGHLAHPNPWVRRNAATALGHVARLEGLADVDGAVAALLGQMQDPEVRDWADAALSDLEVFAGVRRPDRHDPEVASVAYDAATQTLEVEYEDGAVRRFLQVPEEEYEAIHEARSVARYVHTWICATYRAVPVNESMLPRHIPVCADQLKVA